MGEENEEEEESNHPLRMNSQKFQIDHFFEDFKLSWRW